MTSEPQEIRLLRAQLADKAKEAEAIKSKIEAYEIAQAADRMKPLYEMVERAHDLLCQWNHTDGCSWGYEQAVKNPWGCATHALWLRKYDALVNGSASSPPTVTIEQVNVILDAVAAVKPKAGTALALLRSGGLHA